MKNHYNMTEVGEMFGMTSSHVRYYITRRCKDVKPSRSGVAVVYTVDDVRAIAKTLARWLHDGDPRQQLAEQVLSELCEVAA